jgi:hypothetical protein
LLFLNNTEHVYELSSAADVLSMYEVEHVCQHAEQFDLPVTTIEAFRAHGISGKKIIQGFLRDGIFSLLRPTETKKASLTRISWR